MTELYDQQGDELRQETARNIVELVETWQATAPDEDSRAMAENVYCIFSFVCGATGAAQSIAQALGADSEKLEAIGDGGRAALAIVTAGPMLSMMSDDDFAEEFGF
jgi:hypothetical protein